MLYVTAINKENYPEICLLNSTIGIIVINTPLQRLVEWFAAETQEWLWYPQPQMNFEHHQQHSKVRP